MNTKKADLHLHSKASNKPAFYALRKINCPESFTTPQYIYETAKKRGMDYVTITDHNTIDGVLEIAHHPDAFISCEFTAKFPETNTKIHVVGLDIDEESFKMANSLRKNVYDLVHYLRQKNMVHYVAHPFFDHSGRLTVETFEKMVLLFNVFEVFNGTKTQKLNHFNSKVLDELTKEKIEVLANKHDLFPFGKTPWIKGRVGGSDDHGGLFIGKTYTSGAANDLNGFIQSIENRETSAGGDDGDHLTLAHAIYSIGYQFLKGKMDDENNSQMPCVKTLLNSTFSPAPERMGAWEKCRFFLNNILPQSKSKIRQMTFENVLDMEARQILNDKEFQQSLSKEDLNRKIFSVTSRLANRLIYIYTQRLIEKTGPTNILTFIDSIGTLGFVHLLVAPYFISFFHSHQNKKLLQDVGKAFLPDGETQTRQKIVLFTDTLHDINGVAKTIKRIMNFARENEIDLTVITCSNEETGFRNGVMNFKSLGEFSLPEYPEIKLHFPPLLEVMDYIEKEQFTRIHISTPGAVGILGLIISKLMRFPVTGTYHTDIPQYVKELTKDENLTRTAINFMIWFYGQMDEVTVPSNSTKEQLVEFGLDKEKIKPLPRWVDSDDFNPGKKDGQFWKDRIPNDEIKFLYVGRVSKEKNLPLLVDAFKKLIRSGDNANLIIVGDGPYKREMEESLEGYPAYFTGFMEGDTLCKAYSSSDVFVFPSTTDTWGNVVLEAQASGLPVIVSDEGGPKELMRDGKTGFVIESNNVDKFAQGMRFFIKNPSEIPGMGYYARSFILKNKIERGTTYSTIFEFENQKKIKAA